MNARLMIATVITFATAAAAVAQSMASMPGMETSSPSKIGKGTGIITALDPKAAKVTLSHGPIAAFGWPAMTMTFVATPPALLKGLKVGEKVAFEMRMKGARAEVTAVQPR